MVKWNGYARYTYTHDTVKPQRGNKTTNADGPLLFRLEPTAEVNDHWKVKARLDATTRAQTDAPNAPANNEDRVQLKRVWAQGNYDKFQVKLGKFASLNNDSFADKEFTGAELSYGKEIKGIVGFGRLNRGTLTRNTAPAWQRADVVANGRAGMGYQYVGVEYNKDKVNAGLAWHHIKTNTFRYKSGGATTDQFNLFALKAGYKFSKNVAANAWYAWNNNADVQKKAGSIEVDYKGAQRENKGTWGAWVAYRGLGRNAIINSTYDMVKGGEKGWEIGGNYTFLKNVVGTLRYSKVKAPAVDTKVDRFFGRVEFFF